MDIHERLDAFLAERRKSDGGWAEVRDGDMTELSELIYAIIKAKFEEDADCDLPVEYNLTDRTKYHSNHFFNVPYHFDRGEEALFDALSAAETNVSIAAGTLRSLCREIEYRRREKEDREKEDREKEDREKEE